jgi:undecaprenyl pyrophosphate synthase
LCSQCSFRLVGDRGLLTKKLEVPELAPTVRNFLNATDRLKHAGTGVVLQVNLLAAYDFEWEINQAVMDGRFRTDRLIVCDPVDVVFRSGCDGRAALSGALPCQTSFSQICLNPAYFPDLDISQISSEIDEKSTARHSSGL